jgi:hypothetical protein
MAGTGRKRRLGAFLVGAVLGVAGLGSPAMANADKRSDCGRRASSGGCSQQAPCRPDDRSSPCRDCYYEPNQPCRDCYYEPNQPCRDCYYDERPCPEGRSQSCPDCYEDGRDRACSDRCDECSRSDREDYTDNDDKKSDDKKSDDKKADDKKADGKKSDDKKADDNDKKGKEGSRLGRLVREIFD